MSMYILLNLLNELRKRDIMQDIDKSNTYRVKSGIFGHTAKFGQPPCLFHSSSIGIKNK